MRRNPLSIFLLLMACAVGLATSSKAAEAEAFDVAVYGSTPGGFCAAIAASREGASVVLVEPTKHVGGVNTGGLSFSDSNQTVRSTVMGLFDEWHRRIENDYAERGVVLPYEVRRKDHAHWTYEPNVAARVTGEMLREANVRVLTEHALESVVQTGSQIQEIVTTAGSIRAKIFIDATYEGDLMAAAGVSWRLGREGKQEYGESLAGKQYPKPPMPISGFDAAGERLPLVTTSEPGDEEAGDGNVMVYSFRLCLTKDPTIRVPFPEPANYDPRRFEVVRRYFQNTKEAHLLWDLYPLPNGKFDANNGIGKQFSMGLVGGGNGWCEADAAGRAEIWDAHKQYILEMYHFLTTDPAVPQRLREELAAFGLCRDEFAEYGHWSPQLYVREGRRMRGMYVLTQKDIQEQPEKEDPIVVSSFPIDSHDCRRVAVEDDRVVDEGTIFPVRLPGLGHGPAYHVPYRSILPQPNECSNLLVPIALSSTHVAFSSVRVEPTWMILGQSAGIAAALAAENSLAVQELPYPELRPRLLAQGQVLDLPVLPELPPARVSVEPATLPGIVLDDRQAERSGHWAPSTNFKPHIGTGYLHDDRRGDGRSIARFGFAAAKTGHYELRMAYSPHETRASRVPVVFQAGEMSKRFEFDQTVPLAAGDRFRRVGVVELTAGQPVTITVSNAETDGFVILDAIQLLQLEP